MSGKHAAHAPQVTRAFVLCLVAYLVAAGVAVLTALGLAGIHPVVVAAAADAAATLAIYAFSLAYGNSSFYDPYWSVAPPVIALWWAWPSLASGSAESRAFAALLVVSAWAVRLTFNWARRWEGLEHEDWRYTDLRRKTGRAYPLVDFLGIHLFPTVQVFLGCLPLYPALSGPGRPFHLLDVAALGLGAGAILVEATADRQLWAFLQRRQGGEILNTGLWGWSRHPNYLGEIFFWWSVWLFGVAADPSWWWSGIGALAITLMFHFISVPMLDQRSLERRPGYAEHMRQVPALLPWPRRRG